MLGIPGVVEQLVASTKEHCIMELAIGLLQLLSCIFFR
jgi:hypothetical protein